MHLAMKSSTTLAGARSPSLKGRLAVVHPGRLAGPSPKFVVQASKRPANSQSEPSLDFYTAMLGSCGLLATQLLEPGTASAAGGAYGILEGRTLALVHPAIMAVLFGSSVWAGWLGLQWRRTRTIGDDIKELKKGLPAKDEDGDRPASPLDAQIKDLEAERKDLVKGGFKDKHTNMGFVLLGMGVIIAIEGCMNTYLRTGKLFPGPHLWAGAAIVGLWAAAASLTPYMQKGNETARNTHIALNCVNIGLFVWQIPTGWAIVEKVFQFTSWP